MAMDASLELPHRYCFAEFEFRARTGELRRQGQDLRLPEQAGKVLLSLLRASGEVVSREELRRTLWPDKTFGDFEGGLNAAVRKLRLVLEDDGSEPRLIGTHPKRGYRLLVPVTVLEESGAGYPPPARAVLEHTPEARNRWWLAGLFQPASGREFRALLHWAGEPTSSRDPAVPRQVPSEQHRLRWFLGLTLLVLSAGALVFSHVWNARSRPVRTVDLPGGVTLDLVYLPAGVFAMGFDTGYKPTEPVHRVTLTLGFWIGKTEVTQAQWRAVMGNNPSFFQGDDKPVESVSWDDCQAFLRRLNESERSLSYRLPTEAEWEYAGRANRLSSQFENLESLAWATTNSRGQTHPVGQLQANSWGLFDMLGNVWEWCADGYGPYLPYPQTDPQGLAGDLRTVRGGSCLSPGVKRGRNFTDRITLRYGWTPDTCASDVGFRIVGVPRTP
jgi:formylglycine-generating enzyme required for sulfatase activity/DNA-binding winged helix-turn-helix (wHTH) protein